ncbi:MAG: T9SS type A sorting domain-containing protein [Bacteroidales bacterium]|nr:T9SS type A sorting domain-containing protein [Bacteroidales bacterium]MCF8455156.1 T9SS type A sorting domain-containing protein [Bacteroidales bacterium]
MKKNAFLFLLLIAVTIQGFGQYQFTNYTTYNTGENSLGSNTIFTMKEDTVNNCLYLTAFDAYMKYNFVDFTPMFNLYMPHNISGNTLEMQFLACDKYGNLWFEHWDDTLTKFDGINFYKYPTPNPNYQIRNIFCDSHGNVWLGTFTCLYKFNGITFEEFNTGNGLTGNNINCFYEDSDGNVWVGNNYGISVYDGTSWTSHNMSNGLNWGSTCGVSCINQDESGTIWAGGQKIAYLTGNSWTVLDPAVLTNTTGIYFNTYCIVNDTVNHRLWFGTAHAGLYYKENGQWYRHSMADGLPTNNILCGLQDSKGNVWFSLKEEGICRYTGGSWTFFSTDSGLADNWINDIHESVDNEIWAANFSGVSRFSSNQWNSYLTQDQYGEIELVKSDFDGNLCVFKDNFLYRYSNSSWDTISCYYAPIVRDFISEASGDYWAAGASTAHFWGPNYWDVAFGEEFITGLPSVYCNAIERDSSGVLWVGTFGGLVYLQNTTYVQEVIPDVNFGTHILDIRTGLDGKLWIASNNGAACKSDTTWTFYYSTNGLANDWVSDIEIASDSSIWLATYGGVSVITNSGIININESDELLLNNVLCVEQDHLGNMWFGTQHGISMLHNAIPILEKQEVKTNAEIQVYPNPASRQINIHTNESIIKIEIFNSIGQLVMTDQPINSTVILEISDLRPGNYFIRASGKENVWVKKFVVVR